jgi:hypothetical protein
MHEMKALLAPLLLVLGAQAVAACGEYRGSYQTSVSASPERTWELCLLTLEREFAPVSFARREKGITIMVGNSGIGVRSPPGDPRWRAADHRAIVHLPWPDKRIFGGPGDRIEVSVTSEGERTQLLVAATNMRNAASVMRAIMATFEANGVEFVRVEFGLAGGG